MTNCSLFFLFCLGLSAELQIPSFLPNMDTLGPASYKLLELILSIENELDFICHVLFPVR
jgi:hypothetical protein